MARTLLITFTITIATIYSLLVATVNAGTREYGEECSFMVANIRIFNYTYYEDETCKSGKNLYCGGTCKCIIGTAYAERNATDKGCKLTPGFFTCENDSDCVTNAKCDADFLYRETVCQCNYGYSKDVNATYCVPSAALPGPRAGSLSLHLQLITMGLSASMAKYFGF